MRAEDLYLQRRRDRRAATLGYVLVLLACVAASGWISDADPGKLAAGLPRIGEYIARIAPVLHPADLLGGVKTEGSLAYWFYRLGTWSWLLFQTIQMAALATLLGTALGGALCFFASANLAPGRTVFFLARRLLELFRTLPDIVYALILVYAFGVGPLAGIFAIALHTVGAIGKLFAEVVENADMRPWHGVRSAGGNWVQCIRYAILPQVLPNFLSYLLVRFEINVRGSTVIGFVGAGGIGQELYTVISFNYYEEISAIIVLVVITVAAIDLLSERLRTVAMGRA